jgi:hypothetical protein
MWDFNFLAAIRSIEKSMAYVLYRMLLCLGVALGYLFATLAGAGTLVGFGSLAKNASSLGPFGAVVGFILFAALMVHIRPLWLNAVKIPQLGLLVDQFKGKPLPTGKALVDYAKERQWAAYPSTAKMFELDEAIRRVLSDMVTLVSCPKLETQNPTVRQLCTRLIQALSRQNHQTLLAWHFQRQLENPWRSALEGLAVHQSHFFTLTKNRAVVTAFAWLGFVAAYPLVLGGIEILIDGIPIKMSFWPEVFAGVFAWAIKAAFFDAIAEAAMIDVFFPLAEKEAGQISDVPLKNHSEAYRAMDIKAGAPLE